MCPLFKSYDPFREHPGIYSKNFLPGNIHVFIRPFHIAHDLPTINRWLNFQFSQTGSFEYAEDYYTTLLATPNSQPLTGMLDDQPAFEVDVYHASLGPENLLEQHRFSDSDYIMQMTLSPGGIHNLPLCYLSCLDCFFEYEEIKTICWITNADDANGRFIASIAELKEITLEETRQTCYIISKEKFKAFQFSLPAFPAEKKPQSAGIFF